MKLKEIGASVFETTTAGGIAAVASSLFTPTADGRPAVIRRTKKKQDKNPSIYEGDMKTDREAGIKWVDNPEWEQLHNMDLNMVKDFLEHKDVVPEAVGDAAKPLYDLQDELGLEDNILVDEFARYLNVDQIADFVADFRRHHGIGEKAPPGREKQVKALKGKVDNPYAVAWASYNKGKK